MKLKSAPIIVIGMHRCGTSLVSRCLSELGVFMGRELSPNSESRVFQQINREILALFDTRWDDLSGLAKGCFSAEFEQKGFELASRALFNEKKIVEFFPQRSWLVRSLMGHPELWGWKDPRNTWTFPVYKKIFPNAKVIHVYRNGVDCAISLYRREKSPDRFVSKRCRSFIYCFNLWEGYLSRCLKLGSEMSRNRFFELSYEQLLAEPTIQLDALINFVKLNPTNKRYKRTIESINPARLDNSTLREKYMDEIQQLPRSELMKKMGYT